MANPALEVLQEFLLLGCVSFGGPVAHLGYFRERFVLQRQWLNDAAYADLVALCQCLPGPASSQVGMGLGLMRAGWLGALAAWVGFTLPSALLLLISAAMLASHPHWLAGGWVSGLKIAAVAVVAQAVLGMQRQLAGDRPRASLMVAVAVLVLLLPNTVVQVFGLVIGAIVGLTLLKPPPLAEQSAFELQIPIKKSGGLALLLALLLLLMLLPWLLQSQQPIPIRQLASFFQAGSLVFGGGHVVLPLLEQSLVPPGWINADQFLVGYGAAQAVPGPLFSLAAFLGYDLQEGMHGLWGAGLALIALFLPAFLLVIGVLPYWSQLGQARWMRRALQGINAAVVGVLLAALYHPVWQLGIAGSRDFALAATAFLLLVAWRLPAWQVVLICALAGALGLHN
jgi:chromate transporter